ncbi:MAG: hypothetical protein O6941_01270 [Planctomycetota bacterium]|nr:hypothetical protein [Planctomycetota bacterium]
MSKDRAYVEAGFKRHASNASRLSRNEQVLARIEELQGNSADQIADVRDLARKHTAVAVETLALVMNSAKAPWSARIQAANSILDRGWGKSPQTIEREPTAYDNLTLDQRLALIAAIDALDADESGEGGDTPGASPTKH